jgi:hypothetical protein
MLSKFMKFGLHTPQVIPNVLTKWHIQLLHILVAIIFLGPAGFEF